MKAHNKKYYKTYTMIKLIKMISDKQ